MSAMHNWWNSLLRRGHPCTNDLVLVTVFYGNFMVSLFVFYAVLYVFYC